MFLSLFPIVRAAATAPAAGEPTIQGIIAKFNTQIVQPAIGLIFVLATLIFLWGVTIYVVGGQGDENKLRKGKQVILWGLIGMTIMASAWGFVKIICNYFGTSCNVGTSSSSSGSVDLGTGQTKSSTSGSGSGVYVPQFGGENPSSLQYLPKTSPQTTTDPGPTFYQTPTRSLGGNTGISPGRY